MAYYTTSEIDDISRMLETYHVFEDNSYLADYQLTARIIDQHGNEYPFVTSVNKDLKHGRPLPTSFEECSMDPLTRECTMKCSIPHDCPLGYDCKNGQCLREKCKNNSDCSSNKCSNGICDAIKCQKDHIEEGIGYGRDSTCVITPHYHLEGRTTPISIRNDPRYAGMYSM